MNSRFLEVKTVQREQATWGGSGASLSGCCEDKLGTQRASCDPLSSRAPGLGLRGSSQQSSRRFLLRPRALEQPLWPQKSSRWTESPNYENKTNKTKLKGALGAGSETHRNSTPNTTPGQAAARHEKGKPWSRTLVFSKTVAGTAPLNWPGRQHPSSATNWLGSLTSRSLNFLQGKIDRFYPSQGCW